MDGVHSKGGDYVPLYGEDDEGFEGDEFIACLEQDIHRTYVRSQDALKKHLRLTIEFTKAGGRFNKDGTAIVNDANKEVYKRLQDVQKVVQQAQQEIAHMKRYFKKVAGYSY